MKLAGLVPSKGPRGESIPCLFQFLVAAGVPLLAATALQSWLLLPLPPFLLQSSLPVHHFYKDACDYFQGPHKTAWIIPNFKILNFTTSAKSLLPNKIQFTGPRIRTQVSSGVLLGLPQRPRWQVLSEQVITALHQLLVALKKGEPRLIFQGCVANKTQAGHLFTVSNVMNPFNSGQIMLHQEAIPDLPATGFLILSGCAIPTSPCSPLTKYS